MRKMRSSGDSGRFQDKRGRSPARFVLSSPRKRILRCATPTIESPRPEQTETIAFRYATFTYFCIQDKYFPLKMKKRFLFLLALCSALSASLWAQQRDNYATPYDPAGVKHSDVPSGEILRRTFSDSRIYPSTVRNYWIYVPAAYDGKTPACLYVCLDGIQYNAPTVFDNLIATGQMPVTIGVFVASGTVRDSVSGRAIRYNRSNEFDRTDDTFARFLIEELLPDAERQSTSDGRPIRLSRRAEDGAIAGASSGAICAFTVAWQHPERFSRVFSAVGTYVAMRGGNQYPAIVRKTEPKALRIFLQDGQYDAWNPLFGDWYEANLLMESALNFAGYELAHTWGRGGHSNTHASRIFPDAMRWLWKGWPRAVQAGTSLNDMLLTLLPKEDDRRWQKIEGPERIDAAGTLFPWGGERLVFVAEGQVYALDSLGEIQPCRRLKAGERLVGTDSLSLYTVDARGNLLRYRQGQRTVLAQGLNDLKQLLVDEQGTVFFTHDQGGNGSVYRLSPGGKAALAAHAPSAGGDYLALSPDHRLLIQNERHSGWLFSYLHDPSTGGLSGGQRFFWLHDMLNDLSRQNGNMTFDRLGNLYVATRMGVQVCDQNGRVRAILPSDGGEIRSLALVGNRLYILCEDGIRVRHLAVEGVAPWQQPFFPPSQGQG